jgi:N-acyl-L-homoserine lactone synthetase
MPFKVFVATEEKDLKAIFRLRYHVYCIEWDFEKPDDHPDGIETDAYDEHSIHIGIKDDNDRVVGAMRLILDSSEGFPLEKSCELDFDKDTLPRDKLAEISRLAISKDYRRRKEDKFIYGPDEERRIIGSFNYNQNYSSKFYYRRFDDKDRDSYAAPRQSSSHNDRRSRHEILFQLYVKMYVECKKRSITHVYAVMGKGLLNLLRKQGLKNFFKPIGDAVDFHGIRTPFLGDIEKLEQEDFENSPQLKEEFTRDL